MSTRVFRETRSISVKFTRWEPLAGSNGYGGRSVLDGEADAVIEIEIDVDKIAAVMGPRAARAKGKRCVDGFVTVKAHSVVRRPAAPAPEAT